MARATSASKAGSVSSGVAVSDAGTSGQRASVGEHHREPFDYRRGERAEVRRVEGGVEEECGGWLGGAGQCGGHAGNVASRYTSEDAPHRHRRTSCADATRGGPVAGAAPCRATSCVVSQATRRRRRTTMPSAPSPVAVSTTVAGSGTIWRPMSPAAIEAPAVALKA